MLHVSLRDGSRWILLAVLCGCSGLSSSPARFSISPSRFAMINHDQAPRPRPTTPPMVRATRPVVTVTPLIARTQVIGTLMLVIGDQNIAAPAPGSARIELPDIDVSLERISSTGAGTVVSTARTELDGKFRLYAIAGGTYRVCWKAGGLGSGCGKAFTAKAGTILLKEVLVRARNVVYGTVLTGDNRPCWISDAFFKLDVYTKVSLLDAANAPVQPAIRANVQGEYAFGGVKPSKYTVHADCEKSDADASATLDSAFVRVNLNFRNHAPRLGGVAAFDGGVGITRAPLGATIKLDTVARDPESDPIEYMWRTLDGAGTGGGSGPQQSWTLASRPSLHTMYLMARDRKGGYAFKRIDIPVGAVNVGFSGVVIDETTLQPVSGATVSVNGVSTTTSTRGWFSVSAPPAKPERYVLNITHPKYALLSRIHDKASVGQTYELIRVQETTHDPTQVIDVVDTKSSGPCGGYGGDQPATTGGANPGATARPYRRGLKIHEQKPCRHRGAHIIVPAGALVDSRGNAASGPVTLGSATLNPSRRTLPGDYRAIDRTNAEVEMLSFGATYNEFRDSGGQPLNLKPGTTAEIRVPVSDEQRPSAKPTIAIWSYDERKGLWNEEGQASLQNTAEGWMYVGQTKHFSTLNMDVAGNDIAQATCVRFELGASLSGWTNLVLRAYVSYAGTSLQVKETSLDGAQYHAIYRIPYAPPAPGPNSLRLELRGTYNGATVVLLDDIINTDARPKMTDNGTPTALWPDYPYTECGDVITLEADDVTIPYYGDIDATGRPAFLTGPSGQFNPATGEQDATDYYETIDPGNATNPTLQTWWTNHGFNADGSGADASAAYLNFNDLGFGRDMNCKKTVNDLACYVTNYGAPDQNVNNADAAETKDLTKRLATVAMEYKASEPSDRRVRFYVYGGGDPAAAGKLKFADLDGLGPKPVPWLCHVCHGGSYDGASKNALNARFREFDLPSFKYSGNRTWDYPPAAASNNLNNTELTNFTKLNKLVRDIAPGGSPIQLLIDAWYTGGFVGAKKPANPTPPAGWSGQANVYHNVYGKSCRTCHIARDAPFDFTFSTSADYQFTDYVVCGFPKVMPNAYVTYKNFWSDLTRVIDYENFTGADCGVP